MDIWYTLTDSSSLGSKVYCQFMSCPLTATPAGVVGPLYRKDQDRNVNVCLSVYSHWSSDCCQKSPVGC